MSANKENIYAALWSRLTGSVSGIQTSSRRVRMFDELEPSQFPAMYLEQMSIEATGNPGIPSKETVVANVILYAYQDNETGPMPELNGLVNQVQDALDRKEGERPTSGATTTLGGTVSSARVTKIEFGGGNLGAIGTAVLTVEILATK